MRCHDVDESYYWAKYVTHSNDPADHGDMESLRI